MLYIKQTKDFGLTRGGGDKGGRDTDPSLRFLQM